jgi:hypothetical protein
VEMTSKTPSPFDQTLRREEDDNKRKYAANGVEEEAPPKKQKMIDGDDNGDNGNDNNGNEDDDDDDYSSETGEEVSSEEEMNLPTGYEEEFLIRRGHSDDGSPLTMKKSPTTSLMTNLVVVLVNSYCVRLVLVL